MDIIFLEINVLKCLFSLNKSTSLGPDDLPKKHTLISLYIYVPSLNISYVKISERRNSVVPLSKVVAAIVWLIILTEIVHAFYVRILKDY